MLHLSLALSQLSKRKHRRRQALIRTDSGGGTHDFLSWLSYSTGFTITEGIQQAILRLLDSAWTLAL
ncbi:hypothetical protein Q9G87_57065 [Nonomuraea sp. G32]|nr:hypothetical protein [Nonomuraea sp. G32]MDP4511532.1 hypothetical protein [Nonomuraea sp. G32]